MSETVKISANLSEAVVEALAKIARVRGISKTEALRQAISHESFLLDAAETNRVLLEDRKSGKLREVVFG
jgi:hypothetical protein